MKTAGVVLSKTCRCKRSVTEVTDFVVTEAGGGIARRKISGIQVRSIAIKRDRQATLLKNR